MSTNPFRQIKFQQQQERSVVTHAESSTPDGSGSKIDGSDLSLNTNVQFLGSSDRHVSFASPPVDRTITAVSYPSSPESVRSPPWQTAQPATPNYRTAFQRDPFEDLGNNVTEDRTIQEALQNAQSNVDVSQRDTVQPRENAVKQTLERFASVQRPSTAAEPTAVPSAPSRQALDVEAFTRLLLTGDSSRNMSDVKTNPIAPADSVSSTETSSISQTSLLDIATHGSDLTPRSSHDRERTAQNLSENKVIIPPPAPAPRRGKSIKLKKEHVNQSENNDQAACQPGRPAPAPPARRSSQNRIPSDDASEDNPTEFEAQEEVVPVSLKVMPPPPPMRRQHSVTQQRRLDDFTPTAEEPGQADQLTVSSRRSSADKPPAPPSRNPSTSTKRQSLGSLQPPPVPPPRRGRESSRSSMDSFRPSLSSIMGEDNHENMVPEAVFPDATTKQSRNFSASSSDNILAELANLQKEVDAARRSA